MNEDEQDLPVRQEKNASEGFNFTVKREDIVNKVVGLKKQLKKGLTGCLFKTKLIANAVKMRPLNTELEDFKFKMSLITRCRENEAIEHRARRLQVMK